MRRGSRHRFAAVLLSTALAILVAACGGADVTAPPPSGTDGSGQSPSPSAVPMLDEVEPAPGSSSVVYPPNPAAIRIAIEAGHGGCLDWGVPDPHERGPEFSEKAITLAIAQRLRELLEADGVRVTMLRDGDVALAGDHYPELDCTGAAFRDVNGDGFAGFGTDLPEGTRTRDELQARLDLANLVHADALVSIHVDSITDDFGEPVAVARTETFYTDETTWGAAAAALATEIQAGVVTSLGEAASYERQDRGTGARNLYLVAPPLFEPTEQRPDPKRQPTRGALMPTVLVEVGSITLAAEHALLLEATGAGAAARGMFDGIAAWISGREIAARIEPAGPEVPSPEPVPGAGPPFWPPSLPASTSADSDRRVAVRLTNTGGERWPQGLRLVYAIEASDAPYLRAQPEDLRQVGPEIPRLRPGESVEVGVSLPVGTAPVRRMLWLSLARGGAPLAATGSPPLQLAIGAS